MAASTPKESPLDLPAIPNQKTTLAEATPWGPTEVTAELRALPLPPPPVRARGLIVTMGTASPGEVLLFDDQPLVMGRAPDCGLVLRDSTVSARHARIEMEPQGERARLRDTGSTNGTFVNGRLVTDVWLQPGDHVQIGQWTMIKVIG